MEKRLGFLDGGCPCPVSLSGGISSSRLLFGIVGILGGKSQLSVKIVSFTEGADFSI